MKQIRFAFGKGGLTLNLPPGPAYEVLLARSASPLADVPGALAAALKNPIGTPALQELAKGKRSAAIAGIRGAESHGARRV